MQPRVSRRSAVAQWLRVLGVLALSASVPAWQASAQTGDLPGDLPSMIPEPLTPSAPAASDPAPTLTPVAADATVVPAVASDASPAPAAASDASADEQPVFAPAPEAVAAPARP